MAPSNKDFDYNGLKVNHVNGWNANDYHNRTGQFKPKPKPPEDPNKTGFAPLKNVVKKQPRVTDQSATTEPPKGKQTTLYDHQIEKANHQDWKNRGLTNNEIIDY